MRRGSRAASLTLCLRQFGLPLGAADRETAGAFLRSQARSLTATAEARHEDLLKRDARCRVPPNRDTEDAYQRALELLAGDRHLS